MDGEIIASGLRFPEGPVWRDGAVDFVEIVGGAVSRWTPRGVTAIAETGGGPNGAALGRDGALYVTQNGGMRAEGRTTSGIQRLDADGELQLIATSVGGVELGRPNDLAFGPDDPGRNTGPGRIFVLDVETGEGELVIELEAVFPNGIAFLADGTLVWTESFSRNVVALVAGRAEVITQLPERHFPDGLCVATDGRLYVATTYSHGVTILDGDRIVGSLPCGDGMPTNCCFGGTELYVTESRHGTLWRFDAEVDGLNLHR